MLAVWMPWFGDHKHFDVGYSSQDPQVMRRQIKEAVDRNISAFVVDWYGERRPFHDKSFALLQQAASDMHFQVALMYDETENDNGQVTDEALAAFDKAYKAYIGPQARYRDAYLTYNGRPVVFIFPKRGGTDWNRVREKVNGWSSTPRSLSTKTSPKRSLPALLMATTPGSIPGTAAGLPTEVIGGSNTSTTFIKT